MAILFPPIPDVGFRLLMSTSPWVASVADEEKARLVAVLVKRIALRVLPLAFRSTLLTPINPKAAHLILRGVIYSKIYPLLSALEQEAVFRKLHKEKSKLLKYLSQTQMEVLECALTVSNQHKFSPKISDRVVDDAISFARFAVFHQTPLQIAFTSPRAQLAKKRELTKIYNEVLKCVTDDCRTVVLHQNTTCLDQRGVWPIGRPKWWSEKFNQTQQFFFGDNPQESWSIWGNWFADEINGHRPFSIERNSSSNLLLRSSLGDNRKDFWDREAKEINLEIANWILEAQSKPVEETPPVFISYTAVDQSSAEQIGNIIETDKHPVFAQYKDMPPGANFVAEMQNGLASMGRFIPIYTPDYLKSEHCQAEWNAAYNMDPLGKRRLIVGFMLSPVNLLPLQKQCIYVPLYGLTEFQARRAILDALRDSGGVQSPLESRQTAADQAVPLADVDQTGKLTFVAAAEIELPFLDDELVRLPEKLRKLLMIVIASLRESNAPSILQNALQDYLDELTVNGSSAHVPDLKRAIEIMSAELEISEDAAWYRGGLRKSLGALLLEHERLCLHYPLVVLRDLRIRQSAIEPDVFDQFDFESFSGKFKAAANQAVQENLATHEFKRIVDIRERQRKDIASIPNYIPDIADRFIRDTRERTLDDIKKRYIFDQSGTLDRLVSRVEKVTSIVDSSAGKTLIAAAKSLLDVIWRN